MPNALVIDTSSLINFTKFYYFDKYNEKTIYTNLINFITSKIQSNEIKVIDKVYNEWFETRYNKELRDGIKDDIVKTEFLISDLFSKISNLLQTIPTRVLEVFSNILSKNFSLISYFSISYFPHFNRRGDLGKPNFPSLTFLM